MNTETLDATGQELYRAFIQSRDAWIGYIRPKAIQKLNDYLDSNKKTFSKYEYLNSQIKTFVDQLPFNINRKTKELEAKYKKLSIIYHPDKFHHSSSSNLFCLIKKFFDNNDIVMLEIIDDITYIILETSYINLSNLLTNLEDPQIIEYIKNIRSKPDYKDDARKLFAMINSSNLKNLSSNSDNFTTTSESSEKDFLETIAYRFFIGDPSIQRYIDQTYLTEAEFIQELHKQPEHDNTLFNFCRERYKDNENIMRAIIDIKLNQKEKLEKENADLRERLAKLSSELKPTSNPKPSQITLI